MCAQKHLPTFSYLKCPDSETRRQYSYTNWHGYK